jgi:hypothetical protein
MNDHFLTAPAATDPKIFILGEGNVHPEKTG